MPSDMGESDAGTRLASLPVLSIQLPPLALTQRLLPLKMSSMPSPLMSPTAVAWSKLELGLPAVSVWPSSRLEMSENDPLRVPSMARVGAESHAIDWLEGSL